MVAKIYDMVDTWNDTSLQYNAIKMNVTDINSAVSSKLIELQIAGFSKFAVNKLGKIVAGNIDIPKVNGLEEAISVLSAAGLSQVDYYAANVSILNANLSFDADSVALVYADPDVLTNDWYLKVGESGEGSWTNTGIIQSLLEQIVPKKAIEQTFYVTMGGDDSYTGTSIYKSKATINAALTAAANTGLPCVVIVHPGDYTVTPETVMPENCALYGYDLRVTKLRLAPGNEVNNMFHVTSGCKIRGFTFTGLQHESLNLIAPPKKGYAIAFKPGAVITRSPYISDCSYIHEFSYAQMTLPIDRETGNPLMPIGGGNIYADGSVLDPDSPLRSIVVDSFTAVNPNGVGYAIVNQAILQLVSVFTNWARVGIWTHLGGQVTITNSNSSFGDYAFASTGFRYAIKVDGVSNTSVLVQDDQFGNGVLTNITAIANTLMDTRYPTINNYSTLIGSNAALANAFNLETQSLLTLISRDFVVGDDDGTRLFINGLFTSNATTGNVEFIAGDAYKQVYIDSYEEVRKELRLQSTVIPATNAGTNTMINALSYLIANVVSTSQDYTVSFVSTIEASGQQFSYTGSGVNYRSLPFSQQGTSAAPDPTTALYKANGGVIFATFSTERGDTYLGEDIRVDFQRSVIEGQAFSRGVQNITLPLIVGIGG